MKTTPGVLSPFIRSDAVGALLAETFGHPTSEYSLAELGRATGVGAGVVHKEVSRLVAEQVLCDRQSGRNRLVRVNREHPLYAIMSQLILAAYGPVPVLRDLLLNAPGVERAYIYGSWAARREGELGAFPNDYDVLVVGEIARRDLVEIASKAGTRLGSEVNISRVSMQEWNNNEPSPFLSEVKSRPLIELIPRSHD